MGGRPIQSGRSPVFFGIVLASAYLIFCLLSLSDFGITWDEPDHFANGDFYLRHLLHSPAARIDAADIIADLEYYGPFFDILSSLSNHLLAEEWGILPSDCARHLPLIISAAVTVLFTFLLTSRAFSNRAAFLAVLFLMSFPRFVGHSFNNPKDIPITMITIVCYYLVYLRISTGKRSYSVVLALIGGIGFATRIQYVIIIITIVIYLILLWSIFKIWNTSTRIQFRKCWDIGLALILSIPLGLAIWPYFWHDSPHRLIALFSFFYLHQVQPALSVLYAGSYYIPGLDLPWHYAPVILLITTPILTLAAFLMGLAALSSKIIRPLRRDSRKKKELEYFLLLFLWLVLGLIPFVVPGQRVYGGIRHFLFIVPAICMTAGVGVEVLIRRLKQRSARRWAYLLIGLLLAAQFYRIYSFHPFYTVYYNELVGGPRGASGRFQLENWGNAYKKVCLWLNQRARPGATVLALVAPQVPRYYLRPDIKVLGPESSDLPPTEYDFSIYIIRNHDPLRVKIFRPVFSLSVRGQPLGAVHRWGRATKFKL